MRYSGIGSPNCIKEALEELILLGWLHRHPSERNGMLLPTGSYTITPYADGIAELGNSLALEERDAVELERVRAHERRLDRQRRFVARSQR